MQTREQRYASGVYALLSRVLAKDPPYKNSYGDMAHKLPILIRTAGLTQALEFVNTRPESQPAPKDLLNDLSLVLGYTDADSFRSASRSEPLAAYMRLTQETLHALLWFKRYAQSVLNVEDASAAEEES
jgi:CRISPR-associated protein Cmr5